MLSVRNPQLLGLLLLLPAFVLFWLWRKRTLGVWPLGLRLASVAALVLALADPVFGHEAPTPGPLLIIADQSAGLGQAMSEAARLRVHTLVTENQRPTALLWFGANVVDGSPDQPAPKPPTSLDPNGSDIAAALRTAQQLLAPTGGQVVLISDGVATTADTLAAAHQLAAAGVSVEVVPLAVPPAPEVRVTTLEVPRVLSVGEEYRANIVVDTETGGGTISATLRLWADDQLLAQEAVKLVAGRNTFRFPAQTTQPGIIRMHAEISAQPDTFLPNNHADATALVIPPPRILIVEGRAGNSGSLAEALRRSGIASVVIGAETLPTNLSELAPYTGMLLADVPARALSLEQQASVREFVRSEGRGLVVTGGHNAFGLGNYKQSILEEALPVIAEPPPRPQRPSISLLLIVDRSASMTALAGISKLDMAREAAILATETLQPEDRIGILAFDTGQLWVVPFQKIGEGLSLREIQDAIARLPSGGGTDIYAALQTGMQAMLSQPAGVRHIVLLTDGRSFTNDMAAYEQLVTNARAQRMSLSTIAIGNDSDTMLLDQLAQWGGGRYYFANTAADIPRMTVMESEIARADPSVEAPLQAQLVTPHPMMRDFAPAELPLLDGYAAVTPKDGAEVVLRSPNPLADPLLVAWQYGLGRAVAWTPSVQAPWANAWPSWPEYGRFWAQVVRYTLPDPENGPIQVRFEPQPSGVRLIVEARDMTGQPLDLATIAAQLRLPNNTTSELLVRQVAPGRYAQDLLLPSDGSYTVSVTVAQGKLRQQLEASYVQPPPAEYAAPPSGLSGQPLLEAIATITGGNIRTSAKVAAGTAGTESHALILWPWLLGAALVLWLIELGLRRDNFQR